MNYLKHFFQLSILLIFPFFTTAQSNVDGYYFDGNNDQIVLPISQSNGMNLRYSDFTIELFFRSDTRHSENSYQYLFSNAYANNVLPKGMTIGLTETGRGYFTIDAFKRLSNAPEDLRDGKCHHMVLTRERLPFNKSRYNLYVDGVHQGTQTFITTHDFSHDYRFGGSELYYTGYYQGDPGIYAPFKGELREVRVWNNNLSLSSILANQAEGSLSGPANNLKLLWTFEQAPNQGAINDLSGNNNDGIEGAPSLGSNNAPSYLEDCHILFPPTIDVVSNATYPVASKPFIDMDIPFLQNECSFNNAYEVSIYKPTHEFATSTNSYTAGQLIPVHGIPVFEEINYTYFTLSPICTPGNYTLIISRIETPALPNPYAAGGSGGNDPIEVICATSVDVGTIHPNCLPVVVYTYDYIDCLYNDSNGLRIGTTDNTDFWDNLPKQKNIALDLEISEQPLLYPNPVTHNSKLYFPDDFTDTSVHIKLMDVSGNVIFHKRAINIEDGHYELNMMSSQLKGIYFLLIEEAHSGKTHSIRLLK